MNHYQMKAWSQENAIHLGDIITVYPVDGRKTQIQLNRTQFIFDKSNQSSFMLWGEDIPSAKLSWRQNSQNDKKGYYLIEAMSDSPFLLNSIPCWNAIISVGDELRLGYNRLVFERSASSENIQQTSEQNLKIYRSSLNIVLEGETGVGKSYLAKKIHEQSGLTGAFVHINLSSFSKNLIESELFGHVKGAFTGAISDKSGAIVEAHRGTLFLDEIDSLPLEIQLKLLLFLDNKKVRAVGGRKERKVEVRLIFASGKSLAECVLGGQMRKDFYFRITGGASYYLESLRNDQTKTSKYIKSYLEENEYYISPALLKYYQQFPWPGNYRQLKSHLDKKMVLAKSKKLIFDETDQKLVSCQFSAKLKTDFQTGNMSLKELKQQYILQTYYQLNSIKAASVKLGITEKTIRKLISNVSTQNYDCSILQ